MLSGWVKRRCGVPVEHLLPTCQFAQKAEVLTGPGRRSWGELKALQTEGGCGGSWKPSINNWCFECFWASKNRLSWMKHFFLDFFHGFWYHRTSVLATNQRFRVLGNVCFEKPLKLSQDPATMLQKLEHALQVSPTGAAGAHGRGTEGLGESSGAL